MDSLFGSRNPQAMLAATVPFFMLSGLSLLKQLRKQPKQISNDVFLGDNIFKQKQRSLSSCSTSSSRASLADLHLDLAVAAERGNFDHLVDGIRGHDLASLGQVQESVSGNAAVAMVAQTFSDLIFTVADSALGLPAPGPVEGSHCVSIETRANAAEAIRGALANGSLVSMVTSSQGVGQHLPEMIAIANDRTPCVFHIAAGVLADDLSMHGDVGEVLSLRQSGFAFLSSSTPQEAYDLALIAHLASLRSSVPFLHFFDAHRISDEMSRITALSPADLAGLLSTYKGQLASSRRGQRTSSPRDGTGSLQSAGYFRPNDVALAGYRCVPDILDQMMDELAPVLQRRYQLLEYTGASDATSVVVVMGSAAQVVEEYVHSVDNEFEKIGVLNVRLYRPWSARQLLQSLPATVRRIAVLDQSQDTTGIGGLLFMDVLASFSSPEASELWQSSFPRIIGGSYGGPNSLTFSPGMVKAVFDNVKSHAPVKAFTVGSTDEEDTFSRALAVNSKFDTVPHGVEQVLV